MPEKRPVFELLALALATALQQGCGTGTSSGVPTAGSSAPRSGPSAEPLATASLGELVLPDAERVVAIGDVHGDLDATRRALRLAGAIDEKDHWVGSSLVVVQVGDQLDRGDDERAILDLFDRLRDEAAAAGGRFVALNGNHEVMNVALDFRYVNDAGFTSFVDLASGSGGSPREGRQRAFAPGGPYAKLLAEQPIALRVGSTLFVHGGVLPKHVAGGLAKLDAETRAWMRGERPAPPKLVSDEDGLVWARHYSAQPSARECAQLAQVLDATGAKRMVMGHTVQRGGANSACDGKAWRIDTGMSRAYQGPVQVLEIKGDSVRVVAEPPSK
jgi:hypothetical protein